MHLPKHVCFEPLLADDVTERSLADLLRAEWRDAVINGLEAAILVAVVLVWFSTPLWLVLAMIAGAVVLGTLLHQVVLVLGVLGLRLWRGGGMSSAGT